MSLKKYCRDTARAIAHGDDNQSAYVETLLTNTLKTLFEFRYPAAVWGNGDIISLDTDADPGSEAVQWLQIGDVGEFATVADGGGDLPQVDINGSVQSNRAETVAAFITYTEQELQASNMQKLLSVASQKGQAAARSYQRTLGHKILHGSGSLPGGGVSGGWGIDQSMDARRPSGNRARQALTTWAPRPRRDTTR